jgi:hypothetical protein
LMRRSVGRLAQASTFFYTSTLLRIYTSTHHALF